MSVDRKTYRPEPAVAVLALRGIKKRELARKLGLSDVYVGRVLNGRLPAPPVFRARVATLLRLPQRALFRVEKLPAPQTKRAAAAFKDAHHSVTVRHEGHNQKHADRVVRAAP